jgi:hypothetical protein
MRWNNNKQIENQGLLHVSRIINTSGCILNKIDGSNDIGLDAYLEFTENESVTGLCIGVQVKSGDSYQTSDKRFAKFDSNKSHFTYWKSHSLPIAIIIYIPNDDKAYWIDITKYITQNPETLKQDYHSVKIDKASVFDDKLFF